MRSKTIPPEQAEKIREALRQLVTDRFEGKVPAAARRIGLTHSTIYEVLQGTRSPGMKVVVSIARFTGQDANELLGIQRKVVLPAMLGARDDFREARAAIETRNARSVRPVPADVLDEVATFQNATLPERVTVEYVLRLCEAVIQGREDSWRDLTAELQAKATERAADKIRPHRKPGR